MKIIKRPEMLGNEIATYLNVTLNHGNPARDVIMKFYNGAATLAPVRWAYQRPDDDKPKEKLWMLELG